MSKKLSQYVLIVSETLPKKHSRAGQATNFISSIGNKTKKHTLRGNYELWAKRFEKINAGEAYLSIRTWSGKPYKSMQYEQYRLYDTDGIGIQKLEDPNNFIYASINGKRFNWDVIAMNDGLSFIDFSDWFKVRSQEPMAIIHFTNFRY